MTDDTLSRQGASEMFKPPGCPDVNAFPNIDCSLPLSLFAANHINPTLGPQAGVLLCSSISKQCSVVGRAHAGGKQPGNEAWSYHRLSL